MASTPTEILAWYPQESKKTTLYKVDEEQKARITYLNLSPDNSLLTMGINHHCPLKKYPAYYSLRLCALKNDQLHEKYTVSNSKAPITSCIFNLQNTQYCVTSSDGSAHIYSIQTGETECSFYPEKEQFGLHFQARYPSALLSAFSKDGTLLSVKYSNDRICTWNIQTKELIAKIVCYDPVINEQKLRYIQSNPNVFYNNNENAYQNMRSSDPLTAITLNNDGTQIVAAHLQFKPKHELKEYYGYTTHNKWLEFEKNKWFKNYTQDISIPFLRIFSYPDKILKALAFLSADHINSKSAALLEKVIAQQSLSDDEKETLQKLIPRKLFKLLQNTYTI